MKIEDFARYIDAAAPEGDPDSAAAERHSAPRRRVPLVGAAVGLLLALVGLVAVFAVWTSGDDTATVQTDSPTSSVGPGGGPAAIENRIWVLDPEASGVPAATRGPLSFQLIGGRIRIDGVACNYGQGEYTLQSDQLTTTGVFVSAGGCLNDSDAEIATANAQVATLQGRSTVRLDGDRLTITGEPGEPTLVFRAVDGDPSIDQAALAGVWTVTFPDGTVADEPVGFDERGGYSIVEDCVRWGGRLGVSGGMVEATEASGALIDGCVRTGTIPTGRSRQHVIQATRIVRSSPAGGLDIYDGVGLYLAHLDRRTDPVPPDTSTPPLP